MASSSGSIITGYWYRMGLHFGVCHGPVDLLGRVLVGDRVVWCGKAYNSQSLALARPDLFGGESREGGVEGTLDIMMGESTQNANTYLTEKQTGPQPGYRGLFGGVFRGGKVAANNPYVKPWAFTVTRTVKGWENDTPFLPGLASIPLGSFNCSEPVAVSYIVDMSVGVTDVTPNGQTQAVNMLSAVIASIRGLAASHGSAGTPVYFHLALVGLLGPGGSNVNVTYELADPSVTESQLLQIADDLETLYLPDAGGAYFDIPVVSDYLPTFFSLVPPGVRKESIILTGSPPSKSGTYDSDLMAQESAAHVAQLEGVSVLGINIEDVSPSYLQQIVQPADHSELFTLPGSDPDNLLSFMNYGVYTPVTSMNPAHIIYECLTNTQWGMGYPASSIDTDSFESAATTFFNEGFGLCGVWNQQEPIGEFIARVLDHCGALQQVDRRTGKFKLKAIREDYDIGTLPVFGEDQILSVRSYQRPGYGDLVNEINLTYTDVFTSKEGGITLQNLAGVQAQGGVVSEARSFPMLPSFPLASQVAQRELLESSTPLASLKIECNRSAWDLEPGDVIKVEWPKLGITALPCRVLQVDYGKLGASKILVSLVEDIFGLPDVGFTEEQPSGWEEPDSSASSVDPSAIVEAPYYRIATQFAPADFDAVKNEDDVGFVRTLGARPTGLSLGYQLHTKLASAAGYSQRPGTWAFAPWGELAGGIDQTSSELFVEGVVGDLPSPLPSNSLAMIGDGRAAEWVHVTAVDPEISTEGLRVTVLRGMLDTVPQDWPANSRVWLSMTRMGVDQTEYTHGDVVQAKTVCVATGGVFNLASQPTLSMTLASRFGRPYPPGNFKINGVSYPTAPPTFPLVLTWAHRDRVQQTGPLIPQSDGDIGPEDGTTYTVRVTLNGDLIDEVTGITGTTYTIEETTEFDMGLYEIELVSVRGGLESWQGQQFRFDTTPDNPTDPYFASVVTLLHFEGVDGSTSFIDETGKTWTANGNAQLDTGQSKFGGSSLTLDGTGDYASTPSSSDWAFGTGDFTIETFVRFRSGTTTQLIARNLSADLAKGFTFRTLFVDGNVQFLAAGNSHVAPWVPSANVWYHLAVSRVSGTQRIFADGVQIGADQASSVDILLSSDPLQLGSNTPAGFAIELNGWLDEFRITKGVGRYSANFTPPSQPFPDQ